MLTAAELRSLPIIVRNNSAEFRFPFDFTLVRWAKINIKDLVSDFFALMRLRGNFRPERNRRDRPQWKMDSTSEYHGN
jgi:hypothetical protein